MPTVDEKKSTKSITCTVEMSGGLELLFDRVKKHIVSLSLPADNDDDFVPVSALITHLKDNLLTERPELFVQNDTVRPGILVLLNETDWEIEGGMEAPVREGDVVAFISTLHGG